MGLPLRESLNLGEPDISHIHDDRSICTTGFGLVLAFSIRNIPELLGIIKIDIVQLNRRPNTIQFIEETAINRP